jgi:hypothetical protein
MHEALLVVPGDVVGGDSNLAAISAVLRSPARPTPSCAGISGNYRGATCHGEGQLYRSGQCARCALRDDLTALIVDGAADPITMGTIVTILRGVDRTEGILSWKRSLAVRALLTGLAGGNIPLSHDGLDAAGQSR